MTFCVGLSLGMKVTESFGFEVKQDPENLRFCVTWTTTCATRSPFPNGWVTWKVLKPIASSGIREPRCRGQCLAFYDAFYTSSFKSDRSLCHVLSQRIDGKTQRVMSRKSGPKLSFERHY